MIIIMYLSLEDNQGYVTDDLGTHFLESRRFGVQAIVPALKKHATIKAKAGHKLQIIVCQSCTSM